MCTPPKVVYFKVSSLHLGSATRGLADVVAVRSAVEYAIEAIKVGSLSAVSTVLSLTYVFS